MLRQSTMQHSTRRGVYRGQISSLNVTPTSPETSVGCPEFPVLTSLRSEGIQRKETATPAHPAAENVQALFRGEENKQGPPPAFVPFEADEHQRTKSPQQAQWDAT